MGMLIQHPHFFGQIHMLISMQDFFQFVDSRCQKFVLMIYQFELSVPFSISLTEDMNGIVLQLVLHQAQGHHGKDLVIQYGIEQYPRAVGFPGGDIG